MKCPDCTATPGQYVGFLEVRTCPTCLGTGEVGGPQEDQPALVHGTLYGRPYDEIFGFVKNLVILYVNKVGPKMLLHDAMEITEAISSSIYRGTPWGLRRSRLHDTLAVEELFRHISQSVDHVVAATYHITCKGQVPFHTPDPVAHWQVNLV